MSKQITVSVIMITYNHAVFIEEAINGVLMQNCDFEVELIIANDSSPDKTDEVVQKLLSKIIIPKNITVNYTNHDVNKGMNPNYIWAANKAQGKYIANCEGDDYWTDPLKLQKQVGFLEANPDFQVCFTNVNHIDESGQLLREKVLKYKTDAFFHLDMPMLAPTVTRLMRAESLKNLPEIKTAGGDNFLLTYQSKFGKIKFLNEVTANYRIHAKGLWSSLDNGEKIKQLIDTRLGCMVISEKRLKLKLFQNTLEYLVALKDLNYSDFFKEMIIRIQREYIIYKNDFTLIERKHIKYSLILIRFSFYVKFYSLGKMIRCSIAKVYIIE